GPDRVRLLDEFAVAAERFDHLVVALEAQITADSAAGFARGKSAVVRYYNHDRQLMADGRVHLHSVPAECAIAAEHQHGQIRTGDLGADSERNAHPHASVRPRIEAASRLINRDRLPCEVQNL